MRQRLRNAILLVSFLLFPVTLNFLSPYLIIAAAATGVLSGSFLFFITLFLSSLFLGRGFCGWVCPGGCLQDFAAHVNPSPAKGGKRNWIKWFIWVPWFATAIVFLVLAGGVQEASPLFRTESGISVDHPLKYIIYYFVIVLILIISFAAGKRAFCHYACWMAPFMILGRTLRNTLSLPSLHLRADPSACTSCKRCDRACPMSLPVSALVMRGELETSECVLCGVCVDTCNKSAIRFAFFGQRTRGE